MLPPLHIFTCITDITNTLYNRSDQCTNQYVQPHNNNKRVPLTKIRKVILRLHFSLYVTGSIFTVQRNFIFYNLTKIASKD